MSQYTSKYKKISGSDDVGKNGSVALTAVALQDHLMRNLSLNLSDPLRPPRHGPVHRPKVKTIKPVVITRRGNGYKSDKEPAKTNPDDEKKEYVLDPKPPPLTLAQKLGIVDCPEQLLSEDEWSRIKDKSNKRDDSKEPCVICKEDFGTQEQVLLSCTHVFHRACIQAFERFAGKKSCPMCRKEQYQTRVIYEGASYYHHKCATRIQSLWRGYVVKCWYKKLRETIPPKDPILRKKFYEQKLESITDRMLRSVDTDVDGFLRELERSLEASRDVFREFEGATRVISEDDWEDIQLKAVVRGAVDCPICLTALESQGLVATALTKSSNEAMISANTSTTQKSADKSLRNQIKPRTIRDSNNKPVAKTVKASQKSSPSHKNSPQNCKTHEQGQVKGHRSRVLLSCSHLFHKTCLEAFEVFSDGERCNVCPVCRSHYQKKVL